MQAPGSGNLPPVRRDWPDPEQVGPEPATTDGTAGKPLERPSEGTPLQRRSRKRLWSETGAIEEAAHEVDPGAAASEEPGNSALQGQPTIRHLIAKVAARETAAKSQGPRKKPRLEEAVDAAAMLNQSVRERVGSETIEGDSAAVTQESPWVREACLLIAKLLPEYRKDAEAFALRLASTEFEVGQGKVRWEVLNHQARLGIETIAREEPEFYAENEGFFSALENAFPRAAGDIDPDKASVLEALRLGLNELRPESISLEERMQDLSRRFSALADLRAVDELRFGEQLLQNQLSRFIGGLGTFTELELCAEHFPDHLPAIQARQKELAKNIDFRAVLREAGCDASSELLLFSQNWLNLSWLRNLPLELGAFPGLRGIHLRHCHVPSLPASYALLPSDLEILRLNNCSLKELPRQIGDFSKLKELAIAYNPIKTLPIEITRCTNLRDLWIDRTGIRPAELPAEIIDWIRRQGVRVVFSSDRRPEWAEVGIYGLP